MKRRFSVLLAVLAMSFFLTLPAFAMEEKPSVELSYVSISHNSANGWSPTLWYRNNTDKIIKYYDWYFTLYNRVDDPTEDEITHSSTIHLQVVGPSEPEKEISLDKTRYESFLNYQNATKRISYNEKIYDVKIDFDGNYLIQPDPYNINSDIYLTDAEIKNRTFEKRTTFNNAWYSNVFSYVRLQKVVVTYMDGTVETIVGSVAEANRLNDSLSNENYNSDLKQYRPVYNYKDYKALNPDLANLYGNNQYKYYEHFITSGMKEGRQGSKSFNLAAYKANNPDLAAAFGDDNAKYYEHYIATGKAEGRKAT
nr:MAG TPA: hypothetical protein [Caudoviricetes sp.]